MRILFIMLLIGFAYGFPETESEGGKGSRKNLFVVPELGSGAGNPDLEISGDDDDDDYHYIEEPSTSPRVADLATSTPSFTYDSDLIIDTETLAISSMAPTATPTINSVPTDSEEGEDFEGDIIDDDDTVNINTSNYSDSLGSYLIPSVLVAVMILLSLIIACLISRKKKLHWGCE